MSRSATPADRGMPADGTADRAAVRRRFEADRGLTLDRFQVEACDALDAGRSVLVAAPTGSGKTVVAEYAIASVTAAGRKAFYTTPIKALSNQKFADLRRAYGDESVGLLTGDNSINGEAPVVVMTTEVLRNMLYARSSTLEGLGVVVLDEVHYLGNPYRGAVWEEVIIHLAPEVDIVCLSATVSNAEEFADWLTTVRGDTAAIIEERRPVVLEHRYLVGERGSDDLQMLPVFVGPDRGAGHGKPNPDAIRLDARSGGAARAGGRGRYPGRSRGRLVSPRRVEVLDRLRDEGMLPAIYFIFSRAACDDAVQQCLRAGLRLTTPDERAAIRAIAEAHVDALSDDDLDALGYGEWMAGLEAGIASHHAGMIPPMKEAVEEAFTRGLVKAVFATETLALGINMPARSVVIERLAKFTGERHEMLTPGEYTQLTGRAGRRGIDEVGYAVVLWNPFVPFEQIAGLASTRSYALTSSFRPTYNMAANLVARYQPDTARHLLNLSFAQYRADTEVVRLERQLDRLAAEQTEVEVEATCDRGDLGEYRGLLARLEAMHRQRSRDESGGLPGDDTIDALRPGDVVVLARREGRAVVLQPARGRVGSRKILVLTPDRHVVRVDDRDFRGLPRAVARVELPRPYAPRNPAFRRTVALMLRRASLTEDPTGMAGAAGSAPRGSRPARQAADLEREVARHPVAGCPDLAAHLAAARQAAQLARQHDRLARTIQGRAESLARLFDRVLALLTDRGYVDGWALTEWGSVLSRLYAESDLLVAESLRAGILEGLTAPEVAAMVSCFVFEARGPDAAAVRAEARWPTRRTDALFRTVMGKWRALVESERLAGLPETRPPDPGFACAAHAWARGADFDEVIGDEELTGGDFVRTVKQLIDVLRQIGDVAPVPATAVAARDAAEALFRGVVAASTVVS